MIKFAEYSAAWESANAADVIVELADGCFVVLDKNGMTKLVNDIDIDVRIKVKEAAKRAGYAIVPVNGRDEVMPTKRLIQRLHDEHEFDALETLEK